MPRLPLTTERLYGEDLVHADGSPATEDSTRPTMTTSTLGRRAAASHVLSLGVGGRASPEDVTVAQLSGVHRWVSGARQVSRTEAVAA